MNPDESLLAMLDATANGVAVVTGIKKQLTDQGWSEAGAERLAIYWITNTTN